MNDSAPPRSGSLHPDNIPQSIKQLTQWCVWRYQPRATGKPAKKPYQPNGAAAKSNDASTWTTFDAALAAYQRGRYDGIGIFMAGELAGVDLDGCRDDDGANEAAAEILARFAATYAEVSPSGAGYRMFCYGKPAHSGKRGFVEVYAEPSWKFLSVTGHALTPGMEVTEQQPALDWLHQRYFAGANKPEATTTVVNVSTEPHDVYIGRTAGDSFKGRNGGDSIPLNNPYRGLFGNHFKIPEDGNRTEVIALFEDWLLHSPEAAEQRRRLPELRGKRLGCHCKPQACHGDVLARLAEQATASEPPPPPVFTSLADAELVEKACRNPDVAALWQGNTSAYGDDASAADMALCGALAWWTNGDAAAIDRLFRQSGLMREKWDSKRGDSTYGRMTIEKAVANCRGGYTGQRTDGEHRGGGTGGAQAEPAGKAQWLNGAALLRTDFPDPVWLVPDLLPETGCYLLSGKPKIGKSWLALDLAMAIAQGGKFLGRDVPQGYVLYLALEDTPRRLKTRMTTLQPDCDRSPDGLKMLALRTDAPRLGKGLEALLDAALASGGVRLIVADTLQKVRQPGGNSNQYELDYAAVAALKRIADSHNCLILILHHLRKESAEDIHDCVSGTAGLTGAADGSLILQRQRGDGAATLSITGRDVDESEHGLRFEHGLWSYAGSAVEVKASAEQNEIYAALRPYGDDGATVAEVCADTGKQRRNVAKLLGKLVDSGRVRIRHTKPAPRYSVCDGDGVDGSTPTPTPPYRDKESKKYGSSGSSGSTCSSGSSSSTPTPTCVNKGGTGGTGGTLEGEQHNSRSGTGQTGRGGTGGTGGTATHVNTESDAVRVAELVALGWSLPNAKARALDEARDPRMAKAGEARS